MNNKKDTNKRKISFVVPLLSAIFFIIGIFIFHWPIVVIIFGYWIEEIANIIFFVIKLLMIKKKDNDNVKSKIMYIFVLLFSSFVHFIFILIFIGILGKGTEKGELLFDNLLYLVFMKYSYISFKFVLEFLKFFSMFFIVYGISFFVKFVKKKEYITKTVNQVFSSSIGPIIAPHLAIVLGGFVLIVLKSPAQMTIVLVIAKILTELLLHNREKELQK